MSSSYAQRERERERGEKGGEAELTAAFDHCSLCQVYSVNTDFTQPVPYLYMIWFNFILISSKHAMMRERISIVLYYIVARN